MGFGEGGWYGGDVEGGCWGMGAAVNWRWGVCGVGGGCGGCVRWESYHACGLRSGGRCEWISVVCCAFFVRDGTDCAVVEVVRCSRNPFGSCLELFGRTAGSSSREIHPAGIKLSLQKLGLGMGT